MELNEIIKRKHLSIYRLSKISNIPYSTISDLTNNTTDIRDSSALTVYKLATALNVSMESLMKANEIDFELFKSEVCHEVKRIGDLNFIKNTLENRIIFKYYKKEQYKEAFYLLAMLDYLSKINNISLCKDYDKLRKQKLSKIIYPRSLLLKYKITNDKKILETAKMDAIPEFIKFNIVENKIRNVA